jgi:hypothetical protein
MLGNKWRFVHIVRDGRDIAFGDDHSQVGSRVGVGPSRSENNTDMLGVALAAPPYQYLQATPFMLRARTLSQ